MGGLVSGAFFGGLGTGGAEYNHQGYERQNLSSLKAELLKSIEQFQKEIQEHQVRIAELQNHDIFLD